jgi:hypothetical protein
LARHAPPLALPTGAMGRTGVCVAFLLLAVVSCACVPPVAGADGNHGSYEQTDSFQTRSALGRSDAASDDGFRTHTNSVSTNDDRAPGVRALLKTTKQNTKARPDFNEGVYRTKGDVFDEVKAIVSANPHTMRLDTVQSTRGGYSSELVVVTVELGGLSEDDADEQGPPGREGGGVGVHNEAGARVGDARGSNAERSNNLPNTKKKIEKTRVLYNYGEHGRELITVEVAVDLLRAFALGLEHAAQLAHPDSSRSVGQTVKALVATVFKIVPMENVNGRELVEKGDFCERKNGRGVDCNRNWEVDWGVKAPDYDPSEEYPGTGPFSEPEAFMMRALLEEFNPHVWVNVHSGMEALFMPFDHKPVEPVGEGADAMRQILHKINTQSCGDRCVVGGGGKGVGYLAHGTATDYVYVTQKTPIAFTWEIYGDTDAHYLDCFRMFNPVDGEHKKQVVKDWVSAAIGLVPLVAAHPDVPMRLALLEVDDDDGDFDELGALGDATGEIRTHRAEPKSGSGWDDDDLGRVAKSRSAAGRLRSESARAGSTMGGAGSSLGGNSLGLETSFATEPRARDGAYVAGGFEPFSKRKYGKKIQTSNRSGMTAPVVIGAVIGLVVVFRCVVSPRIRRQRFLAQIQSGRGARRLSP